MVRWITWFGPSEKRLLWGHEVAKDIYLSTVFLGIDHRLFGPGPPILWETMICGGRHDGYRERYSSLADARKGHKAAVALAKGKVS